MRSALPPLPESASATGARSGWADFAPLLAALLVRLPFLYAAHGAVFIGDEPQYLRLGRAWVEHGVYTGQWPPGFPALVAACFGVFGDHGVLAVRVVQTLLAVLVGAALMQLARTLAGARAARAAGWLYALYLPLVPYAHMAKSEALFGLLFLLALTALARAAREQSAAPWYRLPLAGALLGLATLTREVGLVLTLALAPWIVCATRDTRRAGVRAAGVVLATAAAVIAPWTARNLVVYGKVVPLAVTSGTNVYLGLNGLYTNFDLVRLSDPNPVGVPGSGLRARLLADPPPAWPRRVGGNTATRDGQHVRDGLRFALAHPGYIARTRLLRAADLLTPLSYMVKHVRLESYHAPLDARPVRRGIGWAAVGEALLLGLFGTLGLVFARCAPYGRGLLAAATAALLAPGLLVAMSRFRAPAELLLLLAAGAWLARERLPVSRRRCALAGLLLAGLGCAWYVSLPPTWASLEALR